MIDRYEQLDGFTFVHTCIPEFATHGPQGVALSIYRFNAAALDVREQADGSVALACPHCHEDVAYFSPKR